MKRLGYRSLESLLKQEAPVNVLAAAWLTESPAWQRSFTDQYRSLTPRDFETRTVSITTPSSKGWSRLASEAVAARQHNLVSFNELGAIIILPLPADKPSGSTAAVLALALHALNDIQASTTYLQLNRVRGDFGRQVQLVSRGGTELTAQLLDQPVSWQLVHSYYARAKQFVHNELFEPYLNLADVAWHSVEQAMAHIEPSLDFWQGSAHLGFTQDHQPVSLNLLDVALGACNDLPFQERINHYGQNALKHEVMLRYLKPAAVERAVKTTIEPQLATEQVLI